MRGHQPSRHTQAQKPRASPCLDDGIQVSSRGQRLAGHHGHKGVEAEQVAQRQAAQVGQAVLMVVAGVGKAIPELRPRKEVVWRVR